jgi:hypothetical protein
MSNKPKAWLVSGLTTQAAYEAGEKFKDMYHHPQFDDFIAEVGKALRDVEFVRTGLHRAVVYRRGDTHALGEIGYDNVKANGSGEKTYFVLSRRIENEKYNRNNWRRHLAASKVPKTAVKAACTYLVPFSCSEAVDATRDVARQIINDRVSKAHARARDTFKDLTGEAGYASNMTSEFMQELRTHTFISPRLNNAAAAFYATFDEWKDVETASKEGVYYVGVSDNYGQQVVDTAKVSMTFPYTTECFDRMPAENVADWVHGRVAVLSMVDPLHYVPGVGLRLDDRVFYVIKEKEVA